MIKKLIPDKKCTFLLRPLLLRLLLQLIIVILKNKNSKPIKLFDIELTSSNTDIKFYIDSHPWY
jgi:hypothetical protein